jgi:hypothetical protein
MTMPDNKVLITISTRADHRLTVDTQALHDEAAGYIAHYVATQKAVGAAQALEPVQLPAEVEKTPPAPAPQAEEAKPKAKPWEDLTDQPKGLNFQPAADLHAKMNWVCDNVPKMSRLRILREGAELLCNQLIAKYYKE